jgi:hypothetical protein
MRTADGEDMFAPATPSSASPLLNMPLPPTPTHAATGAAQMSSFMPMPGAGASAMSPDDMLRAYAAARAGAASPPAVALPAPVFGGMTPLYAMSSPATPTEMGRKSLAPTEESRYSHYSGEDIYGGTAS